MRPRRVFARRTGRPKTKWYVTLMARVPQVLADQARTYASDHQLSISEVLRTGLVCILADQPGTIHSIPIATLDGPGGVKSAPISQDLCSVSSMSPLYNILEPLSLPDGMYLGALCTGRHAYAGTGKTLRSISRRTCRLCEAQQKRTKRALAHA